jgi:hypothetical protein
MVKNIQSAQTGARYKHAIAQIRVASFKDRVKNTLLADSGNGKIIGLLGRSEVDVVQSFKVSSD